MKVCKKCNQLKSLDEFGNNKNRFDGKSAYCKECERMRGVEYRKKNPEKVKESSKNWRKNNPENYKKTIEKYLEKNPSMSSAERLKRYRQNEDFIKKEKERRKKYFTENRDEEREKRNKYYHQNKEKEREKNNAWKNKKRKEDGFYRMKLNLRHRLRDFLINESEGKRTKDIVGLDKLEFKFYIQSKFVDGMTWDNYGEWHLDHIKPLCLAKDYEEALILNHYTNLQPLWAEDNLRKNRKI